MNCAERKTKYNVRKYILRSAHTLALTCYYMNLDRFTLSATKRLQESEELVRSFSHPALDSIHLLAAILGSSDSIDRELLRRL